MHAWNSGGIMTCIPTLFQRLSEVPKPTLQRLQVLSIRSHVHALLSLAPSPSLSLIHSSPSPSCSLLHVLFQSVSLSLTEFQSLPSSPLANLWHVPRSLYLHRLVHRLVQAASSACCRWACRQGKRWKWPCQLATPRLDVSRVSWYIPSRSLSPIPLTTNPSLSMRGCRASKAVLTPCCSLANPILYAFVY